MKSLTELQALIKLIDDPDEEIFDEVSKTLLLYDDAALSVLDEALDNAANQLTIDRLQKMRHQLALRVTTKKLLNWKRSQSDDIFQAWIHISQYLNPNLDQNDVAQQFNAIAEQLAAAMNRSLTLLGKINVLNHVFFNVNAFSFSEETHADYMTVDHFFRTGKGNTFSLGLLYMALAQTTGINVVGVGMPYKLLLAVVSDYFTNNPLLYIDVENKGRIVPVGEMQFSLQTTTNNKQQAMPVCSNILTAGKFIEFLLEMKFLQKNDSQIEGLNLLRLMLNDTDESIKAEQK